MSIVLFTIICLSVIGLLLAIILYVVSKKFHVEEDPRIEIVEALLPGANCGGCGFTGCHAFAQSAVESPSLDGHFCPVGGNDTMAKVASALGQEVKVQQKMVAVVRCNGTFDNREKSNYFDGYKSCKVALSLYAGETNCRYGCAGFGDCVEVCAFDAIHVDPKTGIPEVDQDKCTACGACVKACPQSLIELRAAGLKNRRVCVSCRNMDKGALTRKACKVGCIGCGKCAKVCPFGAIKIENNLAYIDFNLCKLCKKCVDECPTGAIEAVNFPIKVPKSATTLETPQAQAPQPKVATPIEQKENNSKE